MRSPDMPPKQATTLRDASDGTSKVEIDKEHNIIHQRGLIFFSYTIYFDYIMCIKNYNTECKEIVMSALKL